MEKTALKIESKTETKEQQKKTRKIPYEKPKLTELGNVEDMTAYVEGSMNFG